MQRFHQGSLIYVRDFDFALVNPNAHRLQQRFRNKYLLIFDVVGSTIFCCFATTLKKEGNDFILKAVYGCNNDVEINRPYKLWHFNGKDSEFTNNFLFDKFTFIIGTKGQIFDLDLNELINGVTNLDSIFEYKGTVQENILVNIVYCLHFSKALKPNEQNKLFEVGDGVVTRQQQRLADDNP